MSNFITVAEEFGINEVLLVPPMIVSFVSTSKVHPALKNIRYVFCGGAPLDSAIIKQFYQLTHPDACLAQVYGMTEAGWITTTKWPEKDETGSVGRLLPNVEAR